MRSPALGYGTYRNLVHGHSVWTEDVPSIEVAWMLIMCAPGASRTTRSSGVTEHMRQVLTWQYSLLLACRPKQEH